MNARVLGVELGTELGAEDAVVRNRSPALMVCGDWWERQVCRVLYGKQSPSRAVRVGLSETQSFELRSERTVSASLGTVVGSVPGRRSTFAKASALRGEERGEQGGWAGPCQAEPVGQGTGFAFSEQSQK